MGLADLQRGVSKTPATGLTPVSSILDYLIPNDFKTYTQKLIPRIPAIITKIVEKLKTWWLLLSGKMKFDGQLFLPCCCSVDNFLGAVL